MEILTPNINMPIIILLVVGLLIVVFISMYNNLIRKRNAIDNAYYSIDVQLKKRYDLIPMLVETVKGYMQHEKTVFEEITRLRSGIMSGSMSVNDKIAADNTINRGIQGILLSAENYPQLKTSENFLKLQGAMNEAEEQLAASRRFLNAAVAAYHNAIQTFPSSILASWFKMQKRNYFEINEEEKQRPSLQLK